MIAIDDSLQRLFQVLKQAEEQDHPRRYLTFCIHLDRAIRKRASHHEKEWIDVVLGDGDILTRDKCNDLLINSFQRTWRKMQTSFAKGADNANVMNGVPACLEMLNIADEYMTPEQYALFEPHIRDQLVDLYGAFLMHLEIKGQENYAIMPQEAESFQQFGDELPDLFGEDIPRWNLKTHELNATRVWANLYAYQIGRQIYLANETRWPNEQDQHLDVARELAAEAWEAPLIRTHPTMTLMFNFLSDVIEAQESMPTTRLYRLAEKAMTFVARPRLQ